MKKLAYLLFALTSFNALADVAVVVNKDNTASFDQDTIKAIYLGKVKSFSNGEKAVAITLPDDSETKKYFVENGLSRKTGQLKAYWAKLIFTGKGVPPKVVESSDEVKKLVAQNPNIIGIVESKDVDSSVKVVAEF